jgi:hypothetical protein
MTTITLRNDHGRDITFSGDLLAEVSDQYSDGQSQSRWHEMTCYRTESGKLVLQTIYRTCWRGESDHNSVHVCADEADLIQVLEESEGLGTLEKRLLRKMGVDATEQIE